MGVNQRPAQVLQISRHSSVSSGRYSSPSAWPQRYAASSPGRPCLRDSAYYAEAASMQPKRAKAVADQLVALSMHEED